MSNMDFLPHFQDKSFWDEALQYYVDCNAFSMGDNGKVWEYFKYCLQTQNRFFFKNPLLPVILGRFEENTFLLRAGTKLYRARIDSKGEITQQNWLARSLLQAKNSKLAAEEESSPSLAETIKQFDQREINRIQSDPEYQKFQSRTALGFEGFDAKESSAPPSDKVSAGRCNPEHVSFLYTAGDCHTAVAEVRPFIRDSISVATMQVQKDLKLIDLYYEYDKDNFILIKDSFWHKIRSEFSILNKGNKDDYLITQYITSLVLDAGYDGIRFRSSLVYEGENYVIFDSKNCIPISSKMYIIPRIEYALRPILDDKENSAAK